MRVHRLIGMAFIPNPENKPQINHIDGNKKNNKIENLEWVTSKENSRHAHDMGLSTVPKKLTEEQVILIRKRYPVETIKEMALQYNVNYGTILSVVRGRNWKKLLV